MTMGSDEADLYAELIHSLAGGEAFAPPPEPTNPQLPSLLEVDVKSMHYKTPRYAVGQYFRTTVLDTPLKVVDATVYGPTAQYYTLAHDDPKWEPSKDRKLSINTNYDRPRVCVGLGEIVGLAVPPSSG